MKRPRSGPTLLGNLFSWMSLLYHEGFCGANEKAPLGDAPTQGMLFPHDVSSIFYFFGTSKFLEKDKI